MLRYPRDMRARWQVIVLVSTSLTLGSQCAAAFETTTPFPRADSPALGVSVRDGLLSVEAKEASWVEVLNEVRQQTGTLLHFSMPLEGSISVSFKDLPAEQALRRLFGRDANFFLLYRAVDSKSASSAFPSEVWILGKGSGEVSQTPQAEGRRASAEAIEDLSALLVEAGKEFARNPQAARDAALHSTNVDIRCLAIAHLSQQGKPEDLNILTEIVRDPDPRVRQSAVETLGPWLIDDPQVRQALVRVMETTTNPQVRQLAADALGGTLAPLAEDATSAATDAGADR